MNELIYQYICSLWSSGVSCFDFFDRFIATVRFKPPTENISASDYYRRNTVCVHTELKRTELFIYKTFSSAHTMSL